MDLQVAHTQPVDLGLVMMCFFFFFFFLFFGFPRDQSAGM